MPTDVEAALRRVVGRLPGAGEARPGQVEMATAVASALAERHHLVVQAGTGTGKSLAYLVPAALSGQRVVVATATKALQDQLGDKDLPFVADALSERGLRFAVLKGRSNYLCRQRLDEAAAAGQQVTFGGADGDAEAASRDQRGRGGEVGRLGAQAAAVVAWAAETATGDRAELADEPDPRVWASFSVTAEECPGKARCPSGSDCFAEAARERAAEADVVVVNLHLLGAHLAAGGTVLPEHDALVVDEAHALEDVVTECLGRAVGAGRLRGVVAAARPVLAPGRRPSADRRLLDDLVEAADRLEAVLAGRPGERLAAAPSDELGDLLELVAARLERVEGLLRRRAEAAGSPGSPGRRPGGPGGAGETDQRPARAALVAGRLRADVVALQAPSADDVAWIEAGPHPALVVAPIDVAPVLVDQVWSKRTVVLTSATLPAGVAARLGAGEATTLDVGSPFAYEERGLLYCAAHLPDRRRPGAEAAIHDELAALIEAAGGRTLGLFTSRAAMERAAAAVAARVTWPVLVQGQAGKQALLARFVAEPGACLFATMGFWQGVDVPGATLSCVVIDRIPFPRPDDPLVSARRDRAGPSAFRTVDLPRAASLLAQGAGRLIRTAADRGVVAVLDSRLATASYRWDLVRALPPMRRTRHRAEAEGFLRAVHAEAVLAESAAAQGAAGQ